MFYFLLFIFIIAFIKLVINNLIITNCASSFQTWWDGPKNKNSLDGDKESAPTNGSWEAVADERPCWEMFFDIWLPGVWGEPFFELPSVV